MIRPAFLLLAAVLCSVRPVTVEAAPATVTHDVSVVLSPTDGAVSVTHRLSGTVGQPIVLVLPERMTVGEATVNGRVLAASVDGGMLEIPPGRDGKAEAVLTYGARPWPGSPARGPFVGAEGAFLPAGSGWLATVARGHETYRISVEVPLPYRAVVTGRLVEETEAEGLYRARFQSETPLEPPSLFSGRYVIGERIHDGIRLRTYFAADRAALSETYLAASAAYIDRFAAGIGPYPFSGFSVISAPQPVGLGFPGVAYVSERILPLPFMRGRSLAHEVLHNWWGNGVGVAYQSGNWAEGLTTFMADYGLAETAGDDRAAAMRLEWLRDFAALPAERDIPLRRFTYKAHDAAQVVGYNKSAFLFVMLRDRLGPDRFDAGIRRFWQDNLFRTASWDDLRNAFETASGQDLAGFFSQWLERAGAPALSLRDASVVRRGGGYDVILRLEQTAPLFGLAVPVRVETVSGTSTRRVALSGPSTEVSIPVASRPVAVAVDPEHALFRQLAAGEAPPIMRDVTLASRVALKIAVGGDNAAADAARALAERLVDGTAADGENAADRPVLLIALDETVEPALHETGSGPVPDTLVGRGSARVWTVRRGDGTAALVIAARDAAALRDIARPLPHYRRQSYLVFDGTKAVERGVWPADASALTQVFD